MISGTRAPSAAEAASLLARLVCPWKRGTPLVVT
jgi:hypothetical protein